MYGNIFTVRMNDQNNIAFEFDNFIMLVSNDEQTKIAFPFKTMREFKRAIEKAISAAWTCKFINESVLQCNKVMTESNEFHSNCMMMIQ